ncbi:unnamed protein product [Brachionus calyciflorus]|uniref:EGF-like domain-containing protein n=1 Tax=Brachionus calyciflorus TaxID=104777 RepID=A0A813XG37_9BILA|nr:unnamed protein product [Brachionus calyciflorus]
MEPKSFSKLIDTYTKQIDWQPIRYDIKTLNELLSKNLDASSCILFNCSNHGICNKNNFECICNEHYYGVACELPQKKCESQNRCLNLGTCVDIIEFDNQTNMNNYDYECVCSKDYFGSNCEYNIDPCSNITCSSNGYCNMKKKVDWQFLTNVNNLKDFETYMRKFFPTAADHSNTNNCQLCQKNSENHKMKAQYRHCLCEPCCSTRYLIHVCLNTGAIRIFGTNLHELSDSQENSEQLVKGISAKFKEIIEDIIHSNISKPFNIFQKIMLDYGTERNVPKLTQIQNYVKYRRIKNGDVNSIDGLIELVNGRTVDNENFFLNLVDDEPFYFGVDISDGSQDSHFHLGISSKKLLENLKIGETFHLDCTYKVVKYGFPLIVFGASDIRRKFYPICFMITSNEQEKDFIYFFNNFKKITDKVKIKLTQFFEFLCIDADRAMANSIATCLNSRKLIMCWYHFRANINKNSNKIPNELQDDVVNDY